MTANGNPLKTLMPRSAGAELPADAQPLTQAEAAQLADGLHALFCAQARALTMGKSGSLPQEAAAELIASMLYTLGVQPDRPESYAALRGADLPALLAQGRDTLERKTAMAKAMAARLCLSAPGFGCIALRDTLSGIVRGLERYDARFFAHRVPGDIDYQLLVPVPETAPGIDYILAYLTELEAELRFLSRFAQHRAVVPLAEKPVRHQPEGLFQIRHGIGNPVGAPGRKPRREGLFYGKVWVRAQKRADACLIFLGRKRAGRIDEPAARAEHDGRRMQNLRLPPGAHKDRLL